MDQRLRFVTRLPDGEATSSLCRKFGISRKTGWKIYERHKEHGLAAFSDRPRRPVRYANRLPPQVEGLIVRLKQDKPHWRARQLRELPLRQPAGDMRVPAISGCRPRAPSMLCRVATACSGAQAAHIRAPRGQRCLGLATSCFRDRAREQHIQCFGRKAKRHGPFRGL